MKSLTELITERTKEAFEECGYDASELRVVPSRQSGVEYQCNYAFEVAKKYGKDPMEVAEEVANKLRESMV